MWNKVLLHEWTSVNADVYMMPKDNITNLIGLYVEYSFDVSSNSSISGRDLTELVIYQGAILNYDGGVVLHLAQNLSAGNHIEGKFYSWASGTHYTHTGNQRTTALTFFDFSNYKNLSPSASLAWTSVTGTTTLRVTYQSTNSGITASDFLNVNVKLYGLYEK